MVGGHGGWLKMTGLIKYNNSASSEWCGKMTGFFSASVVLVFNLHNVYIVLLPFFSGERGRLGFTNVNPV